MLRARRSLLLKGLMGCSALALPPVGWAANQSVAIVSSDTSVAYMEASQAAMDGLVHAGVSRYDIRLMSLSEWHEAHRNAALPQPQVYLALGTLASETLATDLAGLASAQVLCALIPRNSFERIVRARDWRFSGRFSAIYLDQPLKRQLTLIRLAFAKAQRLGVLWGPESITRAVELRAQAQAAGLTLVEAQMNSQVGIFPALKRVLDDCDLLLALPDPLVYNSNSIQNILLSAMRKQVPLVAFSPAYVRAGAILALYQTPSQVGVQAAGLLGEVLRHKKLLSAPVDSSDFEIAFNAQVSAALGLTIDPQLLRNALRQQEGQP